ncbi:MAG: hexokinase [Treponema sp.]|nr:hexokinase [Treponema sp.]
MENSTKLKTFLENHNFSDINIQELSNALLDDMTLGLQEQNKSQQLMAVMPFEISTSRPKGKIIVIDAGGTNFRSCLVEFQPEGKINITEERKSSMIALEREYSKEEFFIAMEDKISYLKDKADEIHFCFSYAMKNLPDGDAQVLAFSKQVKAKEVVGSYIGKELLATLAKKGWTTVKKVKVLNDTVACLLAGIGSDSQNFDSYIGFILGTGINNAYIEKGPVAKQPDSLSKHVIVCECGMFKTEPLKISDFDITLDKESTNPGCSLLEKMCSGVYIGKIAYLAIKAACKEAVFSKSFTTEFEKLPDLSAYQIDLFNKQIDTNENVLKLICEKAESQDKEILSLLLKTIILRSAIITAAVITATAIKASAKNAGVTCNGSTFWKTANFKETVENLLKQELTEKHGINFTILQVENDITVGTAIA